MDEKWESLNSQCGCRSDAMEGLLNLVGLKKVKQAAGNLFKNAMTLQQLSSAQRKKNVVSFNNRYLQHLPFFLVEAEEVAIN